MRRAVEERSGIRAVDIYGLSEVMGPGVSQEAGETQDGLHVWEDHFLPEIIDPVTHEVLPDGEEGELVFTSLTKQAMPVIRYRTRDLTRLLPGTAYPAFRRMQKVTGRTDDMMIVRGVNVFPTQVEEQILAVEGLAPHYLCVLTRPGNLDELTVRVEATDASYDAGLAAALADRIKQRIGVTARVEVLAPHALERSLGKAKRISDQRRPRARVSPGRSRAARTPCRRTSASRFSRNAATPSLPSPIEVWNIASESERCASSGSAAAPLRYSSCLARPSATGERPTTNERARSYAVGSRSSGSCTDRTSRPARACSAVRISAE